MVYLTFSFLQDTWGLIKGIEKNISLQVFFEIGKTFIVHEQKKSIRKAVQATRLKFFKISDAYELSKRIINNEIDALSKRQKVRYLKKVAPGAIKIDVLGGRVSSEKPWVRVEYGKPDCQVTAVPRRMPHGVVVVAFSLTTWRWSYD